MIVKLLTPEEYVKEMEKIAALAALTCRANTEKEYEPREVLGRIIKAGHESVLEHITLTYSVKGLSRACLQELARHRHISLSVESTRHTLKKQLAGDVKDFDSPLIGKEVPTLVFDGEKWDFPALFVEILRETAKTHPEIPNDELKYYLPEFWPTNLVLTSNIRELRHILKLRTSPAVLKEFRVLCYSLYEAVPEENRYLVEDCVYKDE